MRKKKRPLSAGELPVEQFIARFVLPKVDFVTSAEYSAACRDSRVHFGEFTRSWAWVTLSCKDAVDSPVTAFWREAESVDILLLYINFHWLIIFLISQEVCGAALPNLVFSKCVSTWEFLTVGILEVGTFKHLVGTSKGFSEALKLAVQVSFPPSLIFHGHAVEGLPPPPPPLPTHPLSIQYSTITLFAAVANSPLCPFCSLVTQAKNYKGRGTFFSSATQKTVMFSTLLEAAIAKWRSMKPPVCIKQTVCAGGGGFIAACDPLVRLPASRKFHMPHPVTGAPWPC